MNKIVKKIPAILMLVIMVLALSIPVGLQVKASGAAPNVQGTEAAASNVDASKAMAAAICVGLAAGAGAIGMGIAIAKSVEGISRQPEADGKIRTTLMLGLVFVETAIIYALVVAILIIFVL